MLNDDLKKINLSEGMLDSHTHLFHMKKNGMDYRSIISHCFENGLEFAVDIGINPDNFEERIKFAAELDGLYTSHGYYPSDCTAENIDELLRLLEQTLSADKKAIAVGEMGLDFYHNYGPYELQAVLVKRQIKIADNFGKPIVIHSRDAENETIELLSDCPPENGGIIHCFSYSPSAAIKFVEMGFYISFAGNVTYKNAEQIQAAAAQVPLDRLLLETDAPYLSPQKVRGRKNHSGYIGYTYDFVSELRGIPVNSLITAVNENFRRLFRL